MKTREDFVAIIDQTAEKYDKVAALRKSGDPRYFQHQEAMATMFAMLSQQIEVAMMEPFDKVRDATVLADAALKGIIPKASPARVKLAVQNARKDVSVKLESGRRVVDSSGFIYEVDKPVTVPAAASDTAPGQAVVEVIQMTSRLVDHVVLESRGFYSIEIPSSTAGQMLCAVQVIDSSGLAFRYAPSFVNVNPGDRVYHIEVDEYRKIYVKFGLDGVVGYQPQVGEKFKLVISECGGDVRPEKGSPFTLEYTYSLAESSIAMAHSELLIGGSNPISTHELRELCRYPSTYDESAVYLGEFDFLVRRHIPTLRFLSIWNEQIEEKARGANADNINRLFVSFSAIAGVNESGVFDEISRLCLGADDSFDIKKVQPVELPIVMRVKAQVARIHDASAVADQIRQAIMAEFGKDSSMARRGMVVVQFKRVYAFLRDKIPALQDEGSDFSVDIDEPSVALLPEHWRFVSPQSLSITVTPADYNIENWGR